MKNTFKITQALNLFEEKLFSLTRPAYAHEKEAPTYHVKIGRDPSCTCLYSQKTSTVCKHRLWVMLFLLKIPEDSYLLHQKAFTPGEVKYILQRDTEHNMPTVSTAQETSQSSQQATQIHQHSAQHHSTQQHPIHSNILHCNILHCNILHSNILHSNILHSNILHSNILYCNILHSNILQQHSTQQHPTQQHPSQQHPSQQHPTQQHPTLQHPSQQHLPEQLPNSDHTYTSEQLFQKHPEHQQTQVWRLCVFKKQPGRSPKCAGCHKHYFTENSLQIKVNGLYIPQNTNFSVSRTYHFCVDLSCISRKPPSSNLHCPPANVIVDGTDVRLTDVEQAIAVGIPIQ